jgi:5-methyltetrahydrofolate--homocysteine methyltransferase
VKTILGISNVSFGLPAAAREVVNSVFLYHATKAGLDLAIVNAEKLERFASIPPGERELAEGLLFNTPPATDEAPADWRLQTREQKMAINQFHIAAISEHFRKTGRREKKQLTDLPINERLSRYIVEGTKYGLLTDLELKIGEGAKPLEIINGPLMAGMTEVGRLFDKNELIVAEVLQSAESMKAAVTFLEQFMTKTETSRRGKIILATVKGDVHDIGKNLVEIILANNGYEVVNLGIKVAPEELMQAWREHQPDAIGLSGLLVKSAHQMVTTASDFKDSGVGVPLLVGGAALSEKFASTRIGPAYGGPTFYSKDAMTGLRIMNELMDPATRESVIGAHTFSGTEAPAIPAVPATVHSTVRSSKVRADIPVPAAPCSDRRVREVPDLHEIWSYINPYMLYGKHLGFRGNFAERLRERDPKAVELYHDVERAKEEAAKFMRVRAVWQFFEAERDGNAIRLFAPGAVEPLHSFPFGRQPNPTFAPGGYMS